MHGNAINRVPKLFTDSLCAIFTELLQNARRAGATRLNVNTGTTCVTPPNSAAHCITVADNGAGIADPAILLSFGETGWDNATATREDAAGMGLAALARRGCVIHSTTSPTQSWRVTLTPAHFLGHKSAPVHPASATGIEPYSERHRRSPSQPPRTSPPSRSSSPAPASYYPLPVYLNGELLTRHAYLHNALHTETWRGVTFGVFAMHYPFTNTPDLNFHGLCVKARLPRVDTINGPPYIVRADIVDCPQLELVLPARNEPVETPFLDHLREAARAAIYRALAAVSYPVPRAGVHRCAESLGARHLPAVPPRPSSPPGSPKPRTIPIGATPPTTTTPLALRPCS